MPTSRTSWNPPPENPNARCPICLEPVWFFRNERGGCAYFDAIGKPWPLHPCMEQLHTAEDRRASSDARAAYERALLTHPRFAARRATRDEVRISVAKIAEPTVSAAVSGAPAVSRPTKVVKSLDWWAVLSGLMALALSLPVTDWVDRQFEWIPENLSVWAFSLPTILMALAIGWFLLRSPRPKFDGDSLIGSVVMAPILLILGILGNVLTCGLGLPAVAFFVITEANSARRSRKGR